MPAIAGGVVLITVIVLVRQFHGQQSAEAPTSSPSETLPQTTETTSVTSAPLVPAKSQARPPVAPTSNQSPAPSDMTGDELLPGEVGDLMVDPADTTCPNWTNSTQAKEIIVYLTGAIEAIAMANHDLTNTKPDWPPEVVAAMNRQADVNRAHAQVIAACRDAIAAKLSMSEVAVQRLYRYNTLTSDEARMFSDIETSDQQDLSGLLAMSDQRKAVHLIDLELHEIDYELPLFRQMIITDTGKPTEETDRKILARLKAFRSRLVFARKSIL